MLGSYPACLPMERHSFMGRKKRWPAYGPRCQSTKNSWSTCATLVSKSFTQTVLNCPNDTLIRGCQEWRWLGCCLWSAASIGASECTFYLRSRRQDRRQKLSVQVTCCLLGFLALRGGRLCSPFRPRFTEIWGPSQPRKRNWVSACFAGFWVCLRTMWTIDVSW